MRKRIDAKRCVIDEHRTPEETDHQTCPSRNGEAKSPENDGGQQFKFMQPHQFRIPRQVRNFDQVGDIVLSAEDPSEMTVNEALVSRRMDIFLGIGMKMVMAMLRRPPQNALLCATLGRECEDELKYPGRRVGAVRKIAVLSRPDGKHPHPIQRHTDRHGLPRDTGPDRSDTTQVHQHEWYSGRINEVIMGGLVIDVRGHV
jgi:hypothetical protein